MSGSKDRYAVEEGQVVVVRGGKQIAGPKRRPKPNKEKP
jgi:hypothetical protein